MISAAYMRSRLQIRPFQPFRIVTSAGYTVEVWHPEQVLITKQTVGVATTKSVDQKEYDHIITLGILHIAAIEDLPSQSVTSSNGTNGSPV